MGKIDVSWILLTYNRCEMVLRCLKHNMKFAGRPWHEICWCDNGSVDGVRDEILNEISPMVCVLNKNNIGAEPGYNRAMAMASGSHICITGCDCIMPNDWLKTFVDCFEKIPETGIVTMYSGPLDWVKERIRGPEEIRNGIKIRPAMPMGRRMLSKKLLHKIGFFREDFGLYGWSDVEWGHRAEKVCKEMGLLCYTLPDMIADHLGTEGNSKFDSKDDADYWKFKQREVNNPEKKKLLEWCKTNKYPHYNPYAT